MNGHTATGLSNDGLVARHLDLRSATDGTLHDDHARSLGTGCCGELGKRADGGGRSAGSTFGAVHAYQYAAS